MQKNNFLQGHYRTVQMNQESEENILRLKPEIDGKAPQELNEKNIDDIVPGGDNRKETEEVDEEKLQIKKIPSQEEKEFMSKYGTLKKKNSLLMNKKGKRFDSADYFQEIAKVNWKK